MGERGFYSLGVLILAQVLIARDRDDEAAVWCERARETTSPSDLDCVSLLGSLDGFLAARRGDCGEGERLARGGVEVLSASDFYDHTARAWLLLARTLIQCGKPEEARDAATEALAIYEAKGDIPAASWARELLASLN